MDHHQRRRHRLIGLRPPAKRKPELIDGLKRENDQSEGNRIGTKKRFGKSESPISPKLLLIKFLAVVVAQAVERRHSVRASLVRIPRTELTFWEQLSI